jgi:hypothetical protein
VALREAQHIPKPEAPRNLLQLQYCRAGVPSPECPHPRQPVPGSRPFAPAATPVKKVTRMTNEISLEARARQMMAKFRIHEWMGFAAGFLILAAVEVVRVWWTPELPARMVYGWFVPIVGAASVLAIYLSVSMHKALKERSAVDPLARREMCILFLLGTQDAYGLKLMRRATMAANVHALSFGMAVGLLVFSLLRL